MSTWIGFLKWTDQGIRDYRATVGRYEQAKELAKQFDVDLKQIYWTPGGRYDMITLSEAPDTKKALAFTLQAQSLGNLRIELVEAYGPDEMRQIISAGR